jgi:hypothetical protein
LKRTLRATTSTIQRLDLWPVAQERGLQKGGWVADKFLLL